MAWNTGGAPWEPSDEPGRAQRDREAGKGAYWPYGVGNYGPAPSGGGAPAPPPPPPPAPAPPAPPPPPPPPLYYAVKAAEPDIILYDEAAVPVELIQDVLFEDIGGMELINISREDTINGQPVSYSIVKNLSILNQSFNPNNVLGNQKYDANYLSRYAIDLAQRLPSNIADVAKFDNDRENLVITVDLQADETLELEIAIGGTIYKIGI